MNTHWRKSCAALAIAAIMQPGFVIAEDAISTAPTKSVVLAPRSSDEVAKYTVAPEAEYPLTDAQKLGLLKTHVKYVFVLFQENRAFDFYFGTYPGANGLFSQPASQTPGFVQKIVDTDGKPTTISPFLIPTTVTAKTGATVPIYPADTASVDHSHSGMDNDLDVINNVPRNDRYALNAEGLTIKNGEIVKLSTGLPPTSPPTLAQKQTGELVLGHVDCNAAPIMWNYADRFTLLDNFFDTVIGPSTPNALGMFSGQSGLTQWVEHPELSSLNTTTNAALPITSDPQPFWGSALDVFSPAGEKQPVDNPGGVSSNPASNLTYASLGLSFMGSRIYDTTSYDNNIGADLADVQNDIVKIAGDKNKPVNWEWFQEGYDHEPTDPKGPATNYDYIAHHNAPQYFGYEANNPVETKAHLKGLGDFFTAVSSEKLPAGGGVFYVRGGYGNLDGLTPQDKNPAVQADFAGNDDHPGYSDLQISNALIADEVNAIASSPYWKDSAIIITYDETDGEYDHAQPVVRSEDPEGNPLDEGPRIPAIVISPYSVAHAISHERTEHSSIIKFIDELYNLTPLADLPDEAAARKLGEQVYGQKYMSAADDVVPNVGNLFSAFDNNRLLGKVPPLPGSYAIIPTSQTLTLPQFGGNGCRILGITPTDYSADGTVIDPAPADFNPRPSVTPGIPTSGTWTP
jgi:phospholipase C